MIRRAPWQFCCASCDDSDLPHCGESANNLTIRHHTPHGIGPFPVTQPRLGIPQLGRRAMVASASRGGLNGSSPVHSFYHMYFSGLDSLSQTYDPATKSFARGQLEFMGLMNRRAQAVLEIPSRLGQCRTPQDLVNEQLRYWRTAYEQYSETAARVMELMLPLGTSPFGFGPVADQTTEDEHDYLTFPEPQERAPARRVRERKVA